MDHLTYFMTIIGAVSMSGAIMNVIEWLDNPKMSKKKPHSCGNSHAVRRVNR